MFFILRGFITASLNSLSLSYQKTQ